jgi:hypothetical protein
MSPVGAVAVLLFMVASVVVGTRLMWLWTRTRQLPELLLATALWCTGFFGFALGVMAKKLISMPPSTRLLLQVLDLSGEYVGAAALMVFAWRVFRPRERWAGWIAAAWGVACLAALGWELSSGQYVRYMDNTPISGPCVPIGLTVRGLAPAWMTAETVRYYSMLRRRQRLGLAEPLVVNRLGLWALASAGTAVGYAVSVVHRSVFGTALEAHVWVVDGVAFLAFVSAIAISLAFFPPRAYRRWLSG